MTVTVPPLLVTSGWFSIDEMPLVDALIVSVPVLTMRRSSLRPPTLPVISVPALVSVYG